MDYRTHKYGRIEWERRFLLSRFPKDAKVTRVRHINDRYIAGTTLRLRQQSDDGGETTFKLTQKLPEPTVGQHQGMVTSMYLTRGEFFVLSKLPSRMLSKTRHSVPPFGIDVFEGRLSGLVLAEAEFESPVEAATLTVPSFIAREVTDDRRFTGGSLVVASRQDLRNWLAEHGLKLTTA